MSDRSQSADRHPAALVPRPGLFAAEIQGEGVVLDLIEDRYWGLEAPAVTIWQGHESGLSEAGIVERLGAKHGLSATRAGILLPRQQQAWAEAGLWVPKTATPAGEAWRPKTPGAPAMVAWDRHQHRSKASLSCAVQLLRAARWSRRMLRDRGMSGWLTGLDGPLHDDSQEIDWPAVSTMVVTFLAFRRLFVRQHDCLNRSLVLARALRLRGLPADLCFGARKIPFHAHAWVEVGQASLLDPVEELRRFTVIARF